MKGRKWARKDQGKIKRNEFDEPKRNKSFQNNETSKVDDLLSDEYLLILWHIKGMGHPIHINRETRFLANCLISIWWIPPPIHSNILGWNVESVGERGVELSKSMYSSIYPSILKCKSFRKETRNFCIEACKVDSRILISAINKIINLSFYCWSSKNLFYHGWLTFGASLASLHK